MLYYKFVFITVQTLSNSMTSSNPFLRDLFNIYNSFFNTFLIIVFGIKSVKIVKLSEYQMPNDQTSLNDQKKMCAKQLGQLFSSKISHTILQ